MHGVAFLGVVMAAHCLSILALGQSAMQLSTVFAGWLMGQPAKKGLDS
jgi:hypothetical protein